MMAPSPKRGTLKEVYDLLISHTAESGASGVFSTRGLYTSELIDRVATLPEETLDQKTLRVVSACRRGVAGGYFRFTLGAYTINHDWKPKAKPQETLWHRVLRRLGL